MKRITIDIDDTKHAQFKGAAAVAGFTMTDVISAAVDDFLAGKYRPKISKPGKRAGKGKP